VEYTTAAGGVSCHEEVSWRVGGGVEVGIGEPSGTPSQLISRRRPPKEPLAAGDVQPPTAARTDRSHVVRLDRGGIWRATSKVI